MNEDYLGVATKEKKEIAGEEITEKEPTENDFCCPVCFDPDDGIKVIEIEEKGADGKLEKKHAVIDKRIFINGGGAIAHLLEHGEDPSIDRIHRREIRFAAFLPIDLLNLENWKHYKKTGSIPEKFICPLTKTVIRHPVAVVIEAKGQGKTDWQLQGIYDESAYIKDAKVTPEGHPIVRLRDLDDLCQKFYWIDDQREQLSKAIIDSDIKNVQSCLQENPPLLNIKNKQGQTPLIQAIVLGQIVVVSYLIEKAGAALDVPPDLKEPTPLNVALENKQEEISLYLIEQGAAFSQEMTEKYKLFYNQFETAAAEGDIKKVGYWLGQGLQVNHKDHQGRTPLIAAIIGNQAGMVKYLIKEAKAAKDALDNDGCSPLEIALKEGREEIAIYLLEQGVELSEKVATEYPLLLVTMRFGSEIVLKRLKTPWIQAQLKSRDKAGNSPLLLGLQSKNPKICCQLFKIAGIDREIKNESSETVLLIARLGDQDLLSRLCQYYNDRFHRPLELTYAGSAGKNALLIAAECGHESFFKFLAKKLTPKEKEKALNRKDQSGKTALMLAAEYDHPSILKYLLENHSRDLKEKEKQIQNALKLASDKGSQKAIEFLSPSKENRAIQQEFDAKFALPDSPFSVISEPTQDEIQRKSAASCGPELGCALQSSDIKGIQKQLNSGIKIDALQDFGYGPMRIHTALSFAVASNCKINVLNLLLSHARINGISLKKMGGNLALCYAVLMDRIDIAEFLLDVNVNINEWDEKGDLALCCAVSAMQPIPNVTMFELLLNRGANINAQDRNGKTALHVALDLGCSKAMRILVSLKANLTIKDREDQTPWDVAKKKRAIFDLFETYVSLSKIENKNQPNRSSAAAAPLPLHAGGLLTPSPEAQERPEPALSLPVPGSEAKQVPKRKKKKKKKESAPAEAKLGMDLSEANFSGANLQGASFRRANLRNANFCGVDLRGADLQGADLKGANLDGAKIKPEDLSSVLDGEEGLDLIKMAKYGQLEAVKNLLSSRADVCAQDEDGRTALDRAAEAGHYAVVDFLLEYSVRQMVNIQKMGGNCALFWAACKNKNKVVKRLLEFGISANVKHKDISVLTVAAIFETSNECVRLLLEHKADPNEEDVDGHPLFLTAMKESTEDFLAVVGLFLKCGVDPNKNLGGLTALIWAVKQQRLNLVRLLLEYKADPGIQDENQQTAFHYAQKNSEIAKLLQKSAAQSKRPEDKSRFSAALLPSGRVSKPPSQASASGSPGLS